MLVDFWNVLILVFSIAPCCALADWIKAHQAQLCLHAIVCFAIDHFGRVRDQRGSYDHWITCHVDHVVWTRSNVFMLSMWLIGNHCLPIICNVCSRINGRLGTRCPCAVGIVLIVRSVRDHACLVDMSCSGMHHNHHHHHRAR